MESGLGAIFVPIMGMGVFVLRFVRVFVCLGLLKVLRTWFVLWRRKEDEMSKKRQQKNEDKKSKSKKKSNIFFLSWQTKKKEKMKKRRKIQKKIKEKALKNGQDFEEEGQDFIINMTSPYKQNRTKKPKNL